MFNLMTIGCSKEDQSDSELEYKGYKEAFKLPEETIDTTVARILVSYKLGEISVQTAFDEIRDWFLIYREEHLKGR